MVRALTKLGAAKEAHDALVALILDEGLTEGVLSWDRSLHPAVYPSALLAHVACAFNFYHHWSHTAAYTDTARQTAQLLGWSWGGGLYINYAFGLVWAGEVIWSWTHPGGYRRRSSRLTWIVRGFFMLMIFNGAFVFAHGALRWFGLILSLALAACWFRRGTRSDLPNATPP